MKKIFNIFAIMTLLMLLIFTGSVYAASLDNIDIQLDKTTVRPGEEVKLTIQFGEDLGAYTFNIAYDNDIFDYVTVDGGIANDISDKVIVTYYDSTGGFNPKANMSITFRAKSDITTSNPTEFMITADGLANADASVTYDDITVPIVKNVTVEPEYIDYTLELEYTGEIVKGEEKPMTISYSSPMGRYYEHARLIGYAITPIGASVELLATDQAGLEHDIIDSGWGNAQGYNIGGKNVSQVLQARGLFSETGNYSITLQLIDRDNSDQVIAEQTFQFNVVETPTQTTQPTTTPDNSETTIPEETTPSTEEMPTELPKTGENIYIPLIVVLMILVSSYVYYNKKK